MGTGRIRMYSLWVMVVILLLLGVDQGHARPLTWPGGPPDYFETPNWANTPPIRKFVDTVSGLNPAGANNLGQYIPVAVPDTTTYLGIRLLRDRARAVPGEDALGPAADAAARLRAALDERGARGPYAPCQREPGRIDDPDMINGSPAFGVDNPHYLGPLIIAQKNRPVRIKFVNALPTGAGGQPLPPGGRHHHGVGGITRSTTTL